MCLMHTMSLTSVYVDPWSVKRRWNQILMRVANLRFCCWPIVNCMLADCGSIYRSISCWLKSWVLSDNDDANSWCIHHVDKTGHSSSRGFLISCGLMLASLEHLCLIKPYRKNVPLQAAFSLFSLIECRRYDERVIWSIAAFLKTSTQSPLFTTTRWAYLRRGAQVEQHGKHQVILRRSYTAHHFMNADDSTRHGHCRRATTFLSKAGRHSPDKRSSPPWVDAEVLNQEQRPMTFRD